MLKFTWKVEEGAPCNKNIILVLVQYLFLWPSILTCDNGDNGIVCGAPMEVAHDPHERHLLQVVVESSMLSLNVMSTGA